MLIKLSLRGNRVLSVALVSLMMSLSIEPFIRLTTITTIAASAESVSSSQSLLVGLLRRGNGENHE